MGENKKIDELLDVMAQLRDPVSGCPWDVEQNFRTIAPYTLEEAYEVADAIEREDFAGLRSELGDLLFQVVFHARMAEERGLFGFCDVVDAIVDKMRDRHPHVFADAQIDSADAQTEAWEARKAAERKAAGHDSILADVPIALPALSRAIKLQKRAAKVGFDWTDVGDVLAKLQEETAELVEAQHTQDQQQIEDEFGDLLFVMVNLGRHLKIDPEEALRRTNAKFVKRFRYIEQTMAVAGRSLDDASLAEMEVLWREAKKQNSDCSSA